MVSLRGESGKEGEIVLGIDEAGRGPVIGDMFMAGVLITKTEAQKLSLIGVKDSKKLSPSRRRKLFPEIIARALSVIVVRFPPQRIDSEGLTKLFVEGATRILMHSKRRGICPDEVVIDAVSNPLVKNMISSYLCSDSSLIYEHKADLNYPAVAAASIIAKYLRDAHVETLKKIYGDFGSGYPSDAKTREWLKKHEGDYPPIVRLTWKTLRRLKGEGLDRFTKRISTSN